MPDIPDTTTTMSETAEELKKPDKIFDDEDDEADFNPSNPMKSFNKMLNNNKKDMVAKALKEMSHYIRVRSEGLMG